MFWMLAITFFVLQTIRVILSKSFQKDFKHRIKGQTFGKYFSVIVPIVSGDKNLEFTLKTNLENSNDVSFIFIVDYDDLVANEIVKKLKEDFQKKVEVIVAKDIPKGKNEKVFKQKLALDYAKDYVLCIDDDVIMDFSEIDNMKSYIDKSNKVVFGVPKYRISDDFFSNLVVGFVNMNSILTYPVISKLNCVKSLIGACYSFKKEWFLDNMIFDLADDSLADEYEIAKVLLSKNIEFKQIHVNFSPSTKIDGFSHYMSLMKRWMVFANIYIKGKTSIREIVLLALPAFFPPVLLALACFKGWKYVVLVLVLFLMQSIAVRFLQKSYGIIEDPLRNTLFEIIGLLVQPIHYFHSIISPRKIVWRKNLVTIDDDFKVTYERVLDE